MPVIIYGVRPYGTVEAYGGEHAQTRFFHLYYMPLIPAGSHWITGKTVAGSTGYAIGLHGKSVVAGYARMWGPIAALGTFVAGLHNPWMLLISALAIALTAWSWTWRNLRGEAAQRRSDFNLVAFGTRCEPRRMPADLRAQFKRSLDERWSAHEPDRSPNDIARHGTKDANQAVIAYGLLRIAGATRGRHEEDADADRILAGAQTAQMTGDGPYREGVQEASITGSLATVVKAMALAHQMYTYDSPQARELRLAQAKSRSRKQLVGLVLATPIALGGVALFADSVRPIRDVTIADLRSVHPPTGRMVRVTCDSITDPLWEETDSRGDTTHRITMCALPPYLLPVRLDDDSPVPAKVVEGKLRQVTDELIWVSDGLAKAPDIEMRALDVYVDSSGDDRLFLGIFGLGIALGVPVLWVLWFRARRRRKAAMGIAG